MSEADGVLTPLHKSVVVPLDQAAAFEIFTAHFADWWPLASHSVGLDHAIAITFPLEVGGAIRETLRTEPRARGARSPVGTRHAPSRSPGMPASPSRWPVTSRSVSPATVVALRPSNSFTPAGNAARTVSRHDAVTTPAGRSCSSPTPHVRPTDM